MNRPRVQDRPPRWRIPVGSAEPPRSVTAGPRRGRRDGFAVTVSPVARAELEPDFLARWGDLERRALEPNPFLAPQAVLPAARHLGAPSSLRLLTVEADGRLVFLLPVVDAAPRGLAPVPHRIPLRRARVAGLQTWMHSYCFLGTPLVDPDVDLDRLWTAISTDLPGARPAPWLELPEVSAEGPIGRSLRRLAAARPVHHASLGARGYARRRPAPTYLSEWMSSKQRSNLGRKRRALARELGVDVVTVEHGRTDPMGAVARFLELEAAGWKGLAGTAMIRRPGHAEFLVDLAEGFAAEGRLAVFALEAGDRTLAQSIALLAGAGLFGFKRAFDEDLARSSPGTLLDIDLLDWFHARDDLDWIDTSSEPIHAGHDIYGDRMELATTVVGLGRAARGVPALFDAVDRARDRYRRYRPAVVQRVQRVRARLAARSGSTS